MILLKDKVVFVTGGSRGIGRAIAECAAREGARVAVADIDESEGLVVAQELQERHGATACFVRADVTSIESLEAARRSVLEQLGDVDVLVVNAGISMRQTFSQLDESSWRRVMDVNIDGSYRSCKVFFPGFVRRGTGSIVFVTSASAFTGSGGGPHYAASKSAQHGLMRALARELGPHGVTVNAVAPRTIRTELLDTLYPDADSMARVVAAIPVGFVGEPRDVAEMVCFLASERARYVHGQVFVLDGGRSLN